MRAHSHNPTGSPTLFIPPLREFHAPFGELSTVCDPPAFRSGFRGRRVRDLTSGNAASTSPSYVSCGTAPDPRRVLAGVLAAGVRGRVASRLRPSAWNGQQKQ